MADEQQIELEDTVRVDDEQVERTVTQYHQGVNKFLVQVGNDPTTAKWIEVDRLTLVRKKPKPDELPGFYPSKSVMG